MRRKTRSNLHSERGIGITEIIVIVIFLGIMTAILAPRVVELLARNKSNTIADEFGSLASVETTLVAQGGSVTHGLRVDMQDSSGNNLLRNYIIPVAPSSAFATVTNSVVSGTTGLEFNYGLSTVTVNSTGNTGTAVGANRFEDAKTDFGSATPIQGLSTQNASGIGPLFGPANTTIQQDFILAPHGLNFLNYKSLINTNSEAFLKAMFGDVTSYNPASGVYPLELTICDVEAIKNSTSGKSFKYLTNNALGGLYQVTSVYSRDQFVAYAKSTAGADLFNGTVPDDATLGNMYADTLGNIMVGSYVFIPFRDKDMVKSSTDDLKYGYYRP